MNALLSVLLRRFVGVTLGLIAVGAVGLRAQSEPAKEYQIKAVFLLNFVQFVNWPPSAFASPDAPIRIGILGDNPFQSAIEEAVRGETAHDRRLIVQYSRRIADLRGCHVLFVSASERGHVDEILDALKSAPVLTVSEIPDFARRGGIVNFYLEGKKVRFEINAQAAQRHGLKLSSQLLALARLVGERSMEEM